MPHISLIAIEIHNENTTEIFARLAANDPTLTDIRIMGEWYTMDNDIPSESWHEFVRILASNSQIKAIDLCYTTLGAAHIVLLINALLTNKNSPIIDINLSNLDLEIDGIEAIANLVEQKPIVNLELIDIGVCADITVLSNNTINALNKLFDAIKRSTSLQLLDISENLFFNSYEEYQKELFERDGTVRHGLASMLANNETLKFLHISNCFEDMEIITYLFTQGFSKSKLERLEVDIPAFVIDGRSLQDTKSKDACAFEKQLLALACRNFLSSGIQTLSIVHPYPLTLNDDYFYPNDFCRTIVVGIDKQSKIKKLSLNWNMDTVDDIMTLSSALIENESLEELEIQAIKFNGEDEQAFSAIMQALAKNNTLRTLRCISKESMNLRLAIILIQYGINLHTLDISIDKNEGEAYYTFEDLNPLLDAYLNHPSLQRIEIRFTEESLNEHTEAEFVRSLRRIFLFRQSLLNQNIQPGSSSSSLLEMENVNTRATSRPFLAPSPANFSNSSSSAATSRGSSPTPRHDAANSPSLLLFGSKSPVPNTASKTNDFNAFANTFVDTYWQIYDEEISSEEPVTDQYKNIVRKPFVNLVVDIFSKNFNVSTFNPEEIIIALKKIANQDFFIISPEYITITPDKIMHRFSFETSKAFKKLILEFFSHCISSAPGASANKNKSLVH